MATRCSVRWPSDRRGPTKVQLSRDGRLLVFTRTIRSLSDGFVSVLLAAYLAELGFSGVRVGAVATATLLGTALLTLAVGFLTDRLGRRRILTSAAVLAVATGIAFASSSAFVPILLVAIIGTLNPTAGDVSVFLPVEQAILPETVEAASRTRAPSRRNFGSAGWSGRGGRHRSGRQTQYPDQGRRHAGRRLSGDGGGAR
jgi:MFS family permease